MSILINMLILTSAILYGSLEMKSTNNVSALKDTVSVSLEGFYTNHLTTPGILPKMFWRDGYSNQESSVRGFRLVIQTNTDSAAYAKLP